MNLGLLSKYRGVNMGVAIILVVLFHTYVARNSAFYGLHRLGNVGVDMFLFVSGIGLWFSWSKNQDFLSFYKRRFKRIYPTWLIIACLYYIPRFNGHDWGYLIGEIAINWGFWLHDELTFWYMPAIMLLYIVAPFYMELIRRHPEWRWLALVAVLWTVCVQWVGPIHHAVGHLEIFWSRVPIFLIGINMGEAIRNSGTRELGNSGILLLVIFLFSFLPSLYLEQVMHGRFPLFIERLVYIPMTVTSLLLLSYLWEKIETTKLGTWNLKLWTFLGGISLEIYLIHSNFVMVPYIQPLHLGYWLTFLLTMAITIPIGYILQKLLNKIIK